MNEVSRHIEEHIPRLRRYALSLTRNPVAADDLVQECALRALTKASLYRPGTNLRAWLFTIMHNLFVSDIRKNVKWKQSNNSQDALDELSEPASQMSTVMLRTVEKAMMALPRRQRLILYRVGVEGMSYKEVAQEYDIAVGTVKSRCFRARAMLLNNLEHKDEVTLLAA